MVHRSGGNSMTGKARLLQGNESCALGAIAAGVRFFAGYPITPSTEIAEYFARELPKIGGKFLQMEDEIAGLAAVIGASLAGQKAVTATSGPGFSLMQENLGFAVMAEIPCVLVNVMRGGPSTGSPTASAQGDVMQARWGTHGDHPIIVISPYSVKETYYSMIRAVNLAEKYRTPVIFLMDEIIGHLRERVVLDEEQIEVVNRKIYSGPGKYLPYAETDDYVPPFAPFGSGFRYHTTGLFHDETGFPTNRGDLSSRLIKRIHDKIEKNLDDITQAVQLETQDAEKLIVAYGSVARSAEEAVVTARKQGEKVGLFRPITLWPFPVQEFLEAIEGKKAIVVPEMNLGQLVLEVERLVQNRQQVIRLNRVDGELISPGEIMQVVRGV
jgi:2-oxoglutarate ferredoxin oxidoreductase subunit alpha